LKVTARSWLIAKAAELICYINRSLLLKGYALKNNIDT
jgi:hypothetical protein